MAMIYFMRHGQSQANADGVIAGQSESPLTVLGKQAALVVAEEIKAKGIVFDTIISSPLSRTRDTAQIVAETLGYPINDIIIIDDLKEKGSGEFEGQPPALVYAADDETIKRMHVESFDDCAARVGRANAEIVQRAKGTTLVVGHAAFYRMAQCVKDGLSPREMVNMVKIPNATLMTYPL